eukprot:364028-Chlamydomonas_euryale.AAC.7
MFSLLASPPRWPHPHHQQDVPKYFPNTYMRSVKPWNGLHACPLPSLDTAPPHTSLTLTEWPSRLPAAQPGH